MQWLSGKTNGDTVTQNRDFGVLMFIKTGTPRMLRCQLQSARRGRHLITCNRIRKSVLSHEFGVSEDRTPCWRSLSGLMVIGVCMV